MLPSFGARYHSVWQERTGERDSGRFDVVSYVEEKLPSYPLLQEGQSMEDVDPCADLLHTRVDVFIRHPSHKNRPLPAIHLPAVVVQADPQEDEEAGDSQEAENSDVHANSQERDSLHEGDGVSPLLGDCLAPLLEILPEYYNVRRICVCHSSIGADFLQTLVSGLNAMASAKQKAWMLPSLEFSFCHFVQQGTVEGAEDGAPSTSVKTPLQQELESLGSVCRHLSIRCCGLTDADLAYLCSGLFSPSCPLVSLGLFGNSISDQGALMLAEVLLVNSKIRLLDLTLNELSDLGVSLLATVLQEWAEVADLLTLEERISNADAHSNEQNIVRRLIERHRSREEASKGPGKGRAPAPAKGGKAGAKAAPPAGPPPTEFEGKCLRPSPEEAITAVPGNLVLTSLNLRQNSGLSDVSVEALIRCLNREGCALQRLIVSRTDMMTDAPWKALERAMGLGEEETSPQYLQCGDLIWHASEVSGEEGATTRWELVQDSSSQQVVVALRQDVSGPWELRDLLMFVRSGEECEKGAGRVEFGPGLKFCEESGDWWAENPDAGLRVRLVQAGHEEEEEEGDKEDVLILVPQSLETLVGAEEAD